MSTSILYHGFGIVGYQHVHTEYYGGKIVFRLRQDRRRMRCPECGSSDVTKKGSFLRSFRCVPIGRKPVVVELPVQRVECGECGALRQVSIGFADERRTYTKAFERYVLELSRHMTMLDVARHLGVSWGLVKDIQKRNLERRFRNPDIRELERIAIDEISIGKHHQYLTVVLDLKTGAVVYVGNGRGADALDPFWKRIRRSNVKLSAIAIDMSPSYIAAVLENHPGAEIVFDHFHVIKMYNDKLSDLRRELYHEATGPLEKKVLKGTRWLLLKNAERLDTRPAEKKHLEEALKLNEPLALAYYMKEYLRLIWKQSNKEEAARCLDDWTGKAFSSGIKMLMQFANTLQVHRRGILAYYDHPISTGPLEGTNNKIKTLQKQAYGFRDREFLKLKIYALHESRYALVG
ncbi:ISL3 family transposase [uncultured Sphaerochaeta sp.]|uniref:ISL3 family transposase n=1 Tax=uncultured Sphaerochaeta sp. TaxID=886478 RepID=UPI00260D06EC|nr:ISL3 family transposase [uncultured Sphaerochaeta sp.]